MATYGPIGSVGPTETATLTVKEAGAVCGIVNTMVL